jgi:hypothetical protein
MPVFLASLLGGLVSLTGSIVGRAMIALGIGVVTYSGLSVTLDYVKTQALSAIHGLPAEVVGLLGYMGVGVFLNMIFSAFAARLVLNGLTGDAIKKWVIK